MNKQWRIDKMVWCVSEALDKGVNKILGEFDTEEAAIVFYNTIKTYKKELHVMEWARITDE